MLHGRPVPSVSIEQALQLFFAWLSDVGGCVMIAHNCKFDETRLMYHIRDNHLENAFEKLVYGFCDSITIFKQVYPDMVNYKQETLVSEILKEHYDAHNALADAQTLKRLLAKSGADTELVIKHGYSTKWVIAKNQNERVSKEKVETLMPLVHDKIISNGMAKKIAKVA